MRLTLVFHIPGMPFDGRSLENKSLGGSETAGLSMAKEMAKLGHVVKVFCNTEKPHTCKDGVDYFPLQFFGTFASTIPHDVCIGQRMPNLFGTPFASKLNILWVHDLALLRSAQVFKSSLWNVDKVVTVSRYHTEQYKKVYELPEELFMTSRNGIDLSMTPDFNSPRNLKQMVYAARPERGLDVLLETIFPKIVAKEPEAKLVICGYDNTVPEMAEFYSYLKTKAKELPNNVVWAGSLTKSQLYQLYSESGLYSYPTPSPRASSFREVSCISAMESQMCGLPILTSNKGALKETIAEDAGILIEGEPNTEEYQNRFVDEAVSLMNDSERWNHMSMAGQKKAPKFSWESLAKDWTEKFVEFIKQRNDSPQRLLHHFIRRSDIIPALDIAEKTKNQGLRKKIEEGWGFIKDKESTRTQYEKIGKTHTDVFEGVPREPRFKMLLSRLSDIPDVKRVLDFGCAHGSYAIHLSNHLPEVNILGVDVDKHSIEWAEKNRETRAQHKDNLRFMVGDPGIDLTSEVEKNGLFDALVMFEVLEHTDKPWEVVNKLERWVKPGGKILITTPYGPWEEDSYDTYPHRCHVWEIGFDELREMFEKKKKVTIDSSYHSHSRIQNLPLGFNFVMYEKGEDDSSTPPIDMMRKEAMQRPRQTVSLSMICGPGSEQTLSWALDSVKYIADEIIIADCGMSKAAKIIARKYKAKVIKGKDPKKVGFDEARNITLPHCKMDWVLWMDSDEKMMDGTNIHKYLRENTYNGYSIRQHHFAVDTTFTPDLPVRLFRNRPYDGKTMKFYGSCHEHPEIGLNDGVGPVIVLSDVNIAHVGYLAESGRKRRFFRNFPLMQMSIEKYPDRLLNKYFIMRDNMILNNYELSTTGGRVTDAMKKRCEEVIGIYREHFCGKGSYMGTDAIEHYSSACRMLNLGAEVAVAVNSSQQGPPQPEVKVYRFADTKDLQAELNKKAQEALDGFCSPLW